MERKIGSWTLNLGWITLLFERYSPEHVSFPHVHPQSAIIVARELGALDSIMIWTGAHNLHLNVHMQPQDTHKRDHVSPDRFLRSRSWFSRALPFTYLFPSTLPFLFVGIEP